MLSPVCRRLAALRHSPRVDTTSLPPSPRPRLCWRASLPSSAGPSSSSPLSREFQIEPQDHPDAPPSITLTSAEARLFSSVLAALSAARRADIVVRVAGGWVRDKLLGRETHDIDLAVQGASGEELCAIVAAESRSEARVAVVRANPAQSKHLSTAIMVLEGIEVNVCGLRSEHYAQHSRIPVAVAAADAHEDARRRDFTLNALYYNLHTRAVEDTTGSGLADLRARMLRTPLPALTTLEEDPLRALRAVRFAVDLEAELDIELRAALADARVHVALAGKVSRERVALELERLWSLPASAVLRAHSLHAQLGLLPVVLPLPLSTARAWTPRSIDDAVRTLRALCLSLHSNRVEPPPAREHPSGALYLAALLGSQLLGPDAALQPSRRLRDAWLTHVTRNMRLSSRRASESFHAAWHACQVPLLLDPAAPQLSVLRWLRSAGGGWASILAIISTERSEEVRNLEKRIRRHKWDYAASRPQLLDGNEVMSLCSLSRGPQVESTIRRLVDWQLINPEAKKEDATKFLRDIVPHPEWEDV